MKDVLVAIIAVTSPVWVVYLVMMLIRWKEYRAEKSKREWLNSQVDSNPRDRFRREYQGEFENE